MNECINCDKPVSGAMFRCPSCAAKVALGKIGGLQKVKQLEADKAESKNTLDLDIIWDQVPTHAFNRAARATIDAAVKTGNQRAGEYHDSWALENVSTAFLDAVLGAMCEVPDLTPQEKRLIIISAMIDVKLSRIKGPHKVDTYVDLINYLAALCTWRSEYENG